MGKNLLICFDGTWNTPDNDADIEGSTDTNVRLFYEACDKLAPDGRKQLKWYDKGVGTSWYNKLAGGLFGVGLSRNIRQGYAWLVDNYTEGDDIFIIGFSRGAYTARSLVGMLRNCGLVRRAVGNKRRRDEVISEGYQLYRARDDGADTPSALMFRERYANAVSVKFIGVWDTVGALGIPVNSFDWFNRRFYEFHDTELSSIVRHAYQALATDEHRENYRATLWDPKEKPNQVMQQQWFAGAHSNVGGGYRTHALSNVALKWLLEKAADCGLGLQAQAIPRVTKRNYTGPVIDSYQDFLGGLYRITRDRYMRPVGATAHGMEGVHESLLERYKADPTYRPRNPLGPHVTGVADPGLGRIRA
ncbi:MAG: DUF2235 domain-containing protein [Halioglobus sp.]|nr:DUF2235 domain-containing protein [Halioglobus sp.]